MNRVINLARPIGLYFIEVTWSDGVRECFDLLEAIAADPQLNPLRNNSDAFSRVAVRRGGVSIGWPCTTRELTTGDLMLLDRYVCRPTQADGAVSLSGSMRARIDFLRTVLPDHSDADIIARALDLFAIGAALSNGRVIRLGAPQGTATCEVLFSIRSRK